MDHEVALHVVDASPTAVVAQSTTWEELPRLWRVLLDEVYAFVRAGGVTQSGHNVMLYRDDVGHGPTRTRWEIYGDWREDPAELETEISYLVR